MTNITITMLSAANFATEEAKKMQGTLALARAKGIINQNEYEASATFLIRISDLCKAIAQEKIVMVDFYAESLDKLSSEKQTEIENGLEKAAPLSQNTFNNFFEYLEQLEKAMT